MPQLPWGQGAVARLCPGSHFQPSVSGTFRVVRGVTQLQLREISCPPSAVLKGIITVFPFPEISSQNLFL